MLVLFDGKFPKLIVYIVSQSQRGRDARGAGRDVGIDVDVGTRCEMKARVTFRLHALCVREGSSATRSFAQQSANTSTSLAR